MADNVEANAGSGGAIFATDDDGTAHHPYVKLEWGADNTQTKVAAGAGALPIQDGGNTITVDGTVAVTGTVDLGATDNAVLDDIAASLNATLLVGTHTVDNTMGATPVVVAMGAKRDDALAALTPIEGDAVELRVDANGALWTINSGTVAVTQSGTWDEVGINDSGNSITVDWAGTAPPIGAGVEATALRVTLATDSTGVVSVDDNGGALTVDGTVTANLSATDNAVLDAIAASTAAIETAVEGTLTVGSHAVTNAGTFVVQENGAALTALQLIDDTVVAVDAVGTSAKVVMMGALRDDALSALTPAEGDAVNLRVDSTGALHVTGAGGGTQYAVDTALGATPTGTLAVGIRDDALSTLTPVEGDAVGLRVDSTGALWVAATAGAAQYADDEAFTLATDSVIGIGAIRDDSLSTLSAAEGDMVPFRVSSTGALHVTGGGGGTEYTEDVATANPIVGTATMMERDDALSALTPIEGDWAAMRCDANGALWVAATDGGGTLTVDGTVTANLSATDNAVLDAIAASVAGTLTVGSHAVTNAGTFATQVDGAALTALQLIDNVVHVDDAAFTLGTSSGVMMMGFAGTQSVNANDAAALACETDGSLHIHDGGNTITVDGTVTANLSATDNAVLDAIAASVAAIDTDATTIIGHLDGVETLLGTIDTDTGNIATSAALLDNVIIVDDAAFTPATTSVSMAGFQADEASTDSVDEGDAGAARMTLDRKLIVTPQPHTGGGLTIFRSIDLDESEEEVKATAGSIYGMWVTNTATSTRFIKFYNLTAANTTVGSSTPVITIGIPGNSSDDVSGNFGPGGMGVTFDTAISVAATTGVADADTGAPGANEVIVNIFYK